MRSFVAWLAVVSAASGFGLLACITPSLDLGDSSSSTATTTATTDAGVTATGAVGGGCGTESTTNAILCVATSVCPTTIVDTDAMPHCGFRIRNGVADLVCACGTSLCSMGVYDTCDQAAALLASQTEAATCAQVADSRCEDMTNAAATAAAATTTATTPVATTPTTSSASSGGIGCDTQCVKDCGGGEACAAVCNCS